MSFGHFIYILNCAWFSTDHLKKAWERGSAGRTCYPSVSWEEWIKVIRGSDLQGIPSLWGHTCENWHYMHTKPLPEWETVYSRILHSRAWADKGWLFCSFIFGMSRGFQWRQTGNDFTVISHHVQRVTLWWFWMVSWNWYFHLKHS